MRRGGLITSACAAMVALATVAGPAFGAGRCGAHPWCDPALSADRRADLLLSALTPDEKISLLAGVLNSGHTGSTAAVPRLDVPPVFVTDGPAGVRQGDEKSTALPTPIALAATFDPRMAFLYGSTVGNEAKLRGNDGILGPTINIMRTPLGGRTFEAFGEDPYLVARTATAWIKGAQAQGVFATAKHFAANNQEGVDPTGQTAKPGGTYGISQVGTGPIGDRYTENSIVDERTLHEIYLPAFEAAIREAHVGAVMCSYNRVNGDWACANHHLLSDLARSEFGFDGILMSDWNLATHPGETGKHLNAGLDLEMPNPEAYTPALVQLAQASGEATQATIDDHVRRILRTMFRFGIFDRPAYRDDEAAIDKAGHAAAAQRISEASITLLRNHGVLPIDRRRVHSIAVIGSYADKVAKAGAADNVNGFEAVTPLQGIQQHAGTTVVRYDDGSDPGRAAALAKSSDLAVVVAGNYEIEGADRQCLSLECPDEGDQDGLIDQVAAAQPRTVVVLESGGPVLTPWRDRIAGLLEAWYPGERGGDAIARVLFGDVEPGGRLPVTFPSAEADEQTAGDPAKYPGIGENVFYKEGVLAGYRWFDAHGTAPAYPFGFGLSYTRFRFGGLRLTRRLGQVVVSAAVTNAGRRAGTAVAELYAGLPEPSPAVVQPPRQLKGLAKLWLRPGQTRRVTFTLDRRALSYWNSGDARWELAPGCYRIDVGSSSRDLPLQARFAEPAGRCT